MVNKILSSNSTKDSSGLEEVDAFQVVSLAHDPWEAKLFKTSWRRKDWLSHPDVSQTRGKCHSLNTRHPSQGRIPWRNSQHYPRLTLQTQSIHSWLRGHPVRHISMFGVRTHRTVSFWEGDTSHHSHVGIPLIPYYLKLLLNPTMDLFLSVSGWQDFKYFEILGRECFPFKLTPLCRWD